MVMLNDGKVAVQHKPMNQIRQLAHSTSNALRWLSFGNGQTFLVAFLLSGSSYKLPYRENFARTNQQTVDMGNSQGKVGSLILLQLHIDIAQPTANE